jgi:3-hydroxyisobutyrate dehydrogenase-like beta-hydroxyacid dehydrogenase
MTAPRLAFIGFGEAGPQIAKGLIGAGIRHVAAYDILADSADTRERWMAHARSFGAEPKTSAADAVADADVILCTVTSKEALKAAEGAVAHLRQGQLYLDLNSCSPGKKRKAATLVEGSSEARYVDVAVMDTVPGRGHKVPMLLSGAAAPAARELLTPFGMAMEVVGDAIGQASTVKMARSVFMKGFEAIICESMLAAYQAGVHETVLASIQRTYPDMDWMKLASYHMGRMVVHGGRRADEMESVAETLEEMGLEPLTAVSTGRRQRFVADSGIKQQLGGKPTETLEQFLSMLNETLPRKGG